MPKPQGKMNLLHAQILGDLFRNDKRGLAKNVSEENIERMARRWSR